MSEISKERKLERFEMVRAECRGHYGDGFDCGACKFDVECDAIEDLIESSPSGDKTSGDCQGEGK